MMATSTMDEVMQGDLTAGITTRVVAGMGALAPGAYEKLWSRDPRAQVYQSEAWMTAWERHFAPGRVRVIALEARGGLVGALPVVALDRWREGQFRGRVLTIASSCSAAYPLDLGPLIDPAWRDGVLEALAEALLGLAREEGADGILFELYAADSAAAELLARVATRARRPAVCRAVAESHLAQLAPTYEAFVEGLGSRTRRNVRAYAKKFYEAGAAHRVVAADSAADFARLLEVMAEQKAKRFAELGKDSNLGEERLNAFLNEALPALHAQGRLTGLMAMVGERVGGTQLYLHDAHGHAYSYNSSFDMEFKELRLHYILETERFKRAIEAGYRMMDLSTGHAEHKQHWTNGLQRELFEGAVLLTARGRVANWCLDRMRDWKARRAAEVQGEAGAKAEGNGE